MTSRSGKETLASFGEFEFDTRSGELINGDARIRLAEQSSRLLSELLRRPGQVVTREDLQHCLWPDETHVDFEAGISTTMHLVRQALNDSASKPRFIETLPKRGYRFLSEVEWSGPPEHSALAQHTAPRRFLGKSLFPLVGLAVVAIAVTLALQNLWNTRTNRKALSDPALPVHLQTIGGGPGTGEGQFDSPRSIAVDADGNLYVTDTLNQRIQKFDSDGSFVLMWGTAPRGDPSGIVTDGEGNVYVSTGGEAQKIQKFNSSGRRQLTIGQGGAEPGELWAGREMWISDDGLLYIADCRNHRVQAFNAETGAFVNTFGTEGHGPGEFYFPFSVQGTPNGFLYVVDQSNSRVQKFDRNGSFVTEWGAFGSAPGQFNDPRSVEVDRLGRVYVADYGRPRQPRPRPEGWRTDGRNSNHRIQVFDANGRFLYEFGSFGTGPGQFAYPASLAIDTDGHLYVADLLNHRVQKFKIPDLGGKD